MCTFNLTLNDRIVEQVKTVFPSQKAVEDFAQKQLENIFLNIINQMKVDKANKSNVKSLEQLSPEIQQLLIATEPLKGVVPEWDINGDIYRTEALKEKYGY